MPRRLPVISLLLLLAAPLASARIISYAPYSDRISVPAMGHRLNRHFALVETRTPSFSTMWGQIVLYDSRGEEEPRVVFPQNNSELGFAGVAMREAPGEPPMILAVTSGAAWNLSVDGGQTWKRVQVAGGHSPNPPQVDLGGWYARGRYSNIRIGTREAPFVAVSFAGAEYHLVAIGADGTAKDLLVSPSSKRISLAGSDHDGRRFLVRVGDEIYIIGLDGSKTYMSNVSGGSIEGWITDSGAAYVELHKAPNDISLWLLYGIATFIDGTYDKNNPTAVPPPAPTNTQHPFFAVPTNDYGGAWIVKRRTGQPTRLLLHDDQKQRGIVEQWSDVTGPEVEAILPASTPDKILIQVHRPRRGPDPLVTFKDPALAVWRVGTPAPKVYDELYLNESSDKGFVHLDVDGLENGEPFVFDGGRTITPPGCCVVSAGGGGGDVVQEWGVVRGSTLQRLVLPGFGRTAGAFGSLWRTDVTFQNPNDVPVDVTLRFAAAGNAVAASQTNTARLRLAPRELRLIVDAAKELFQIEGGVGALFISPEGGASINATGRTYTQSPNRPEGTYGYGMNAIDVYAATSARFPVTFSGAFQGPNFRTNVFLTDVSGHGAAAAFSAFGPNGTLSIASVATETSPFGVLQRNNLGFLLGLASQATGALMVTPTRGEAVVSLFAVDNRTNDATFFPPDLSIGMVRTIPVVGHLEGANGSQFRSDLFLYNQSNVSKFVNIEMRSWTSSDFAVHSLWLAPREARMFPDVLKTLFNRSGTARLRIALQGTTTLDPSVRVTSRTYTVDANGGTYGFLMPPLNAFQSATTGDTLEILGTALDARFRTNIGLVDVTASFTSNTPRARIEIVGANGAKRDSFETAIPSLGGLQLNDLFRARSLPDDGTPVLIRITPLQGMIGAYAAMLDNDTNDSTYFAANLAAK